MIVEMKWAIEPVDGDEIVRKLERIGRVCWRSEERITNESAPRFIKMLLSRGHLSVFEHVSITAYITIDRGIAQELTRHRLGAYSHESTRYVNYNKNGLSFIAPMNLNDEGNRLFDLYAKDLELMYFILSTQGEASPENARDILPLCTASDLVVTYNLRQWRHVFEQRYCEQAGSVHPKMKLLMTRLLEMMKNAVPIVFDDIE